MNRILTVGVALLLLATAGVAKQAPSIASAELSPPIMQVERLYGDQRDGFRQSCLLVSENGRYHRETRQQEQKSGRAMFEWQSPKVFESVIGPDDLRRLREIIESESFRAVNGTVGDPSTLWSRLVWRPGGGVRPHDVIDIFEASLVHSNGIQVFAVVGGATNKTVENSLSSFALWIGEVEKRKDGRLDKIASSNGCAVPSSPETGSSWKLTTQRPKPIYTPADLDHSAVEKNTSPTSKVQLRVIVNADGSVGPVSVEHGTDPALKQHALDAMAKWKFEPAQLNGMVVPAAVNVEVSVHLH